MGKLIDDSMTHECDMGQGKWADVAATTVSRRTYLKSGQSMAAGRQTSLRCIVIIVVCSIKEGLPCEERKGGDVKYGGREKEKENGATREIEDGRVYRVCLHTHAGDYLTF